jgi:hypothetical protein
MLHGILADGMIKRIEGNPDFANAEVVRLRAKGHAAEYLFGARSDEDFSPEGSHGEATAVKPS